MKQILTFLSMAASYGKVYKENSRHDEVREIVCFTRGANHIITG